MQRMGVGNNRKAEMRMQQVCGDKELYLNL